MPQTGGEKYNARDVHRYSDDELRREFQALQRAVPYVSRGTWTPGISFGGGTTGITYTTQTGNWRKVNDLVHAWGLVVLSAKGSSTGSALITGLPFTVASQSAAVSLRLISVTFANQFMGAASVGTTTVVLEELTEAGSRSDLADTDFANTSSVMVTVSYISTT